MNIEQISSLLDSPESARPWLSSLGFQRPDEAFGHFARLAEDGLTIDLLSTVVAQMETLLPEISDPDMALRNFEMFVRASRSPLALGGLIERDVTALPILLRVFSASQFLADLLINDPGGYDLLRLTEGMPAPRAALVDELCSEILVLKSRDSAKDVLLRFKHRELLRIAYGDIVGGQSVATVASQLTYVADAICAAALQFACEIVARRRGELFGLHGEDTGLAIIALGSLGGHELSYSDRISVLMISNHWSPETDRAASARRQFLESVVREMGELICDKSDQDFCYQLDETFRPEGREGSIVSSVHRAVQYHEQLGRVQDRQVFVKARWVAGDKATAEEFLRQIKPWVYPQFLSRADISGIKALRRGIRHGLGIPDSSTALPSGSLTTTAWSQIDNGIRDIEFTTQFLQLLHGSDAPDIQATNTLESITQMTQADCLTIAESDILREGYVFYRLVLHRLQIMSLAGPGIENHSAIDLPRLAVETGFTDGDESSRVSDFVAEVQKHRAAVERVVDHLLTSAFPDDGNLDADQEAVVDLVFNPDPGAARISESLARYRFADARQAFKNLSELSRERYRFLSTRRCRHFLAAIVTDLLEEIATTPDPNGTLQSLARVSDSLGGKGLLWELFSFNRASMQLFVRLCSASRYLTRILTGSPGMIDELLDALMIDKLPDVGSLRGELRDLTRDAESIDLILKNFKNSHHLSVGVRDVFGRDDIRQTHQVLCNIAEVCLEQIAEREFHDLVLKHGAPTTPDGQPCELIMLAMGRLGGCEPNYHSDLDVVFMYEADGNTRHHHPAKSVSNNHFFSRLSSHISSMVNSPVTGDRLYDLDSRLRPSGRSGPAVISLENFLRHFHDERTRMWEYLALCKARPIFSSEPVRQRTCDTIAVAIAARPWTSDSARQIHDVRIELELDASEANVKRGVGGSLDIEFAIQMLQLKHVSIHPEVLTTNTFAAMDSLRNLELLSDDDHQFLATSYRLLRGVESGLRHLMTDARHEMPSDRETLEQLAYLMSFDSVDQLQQRCHEYRRENRARFLRILDC